jgi:hypothetical protein
LEIGLPPAEQQFPVLVLDPDDAGAFLPAALLAPGRQPSRGQEVRDEDVAGLSPLGFKHVNFLGRYSFTAPTLGPLRQLRGPSADNEDDE